ncbi:hypothetical protein [Erythrobacter sp. BLCC-B19]|uniref:hypothetical protein n=1 Tax=Erythrobacter sp. BLCC-B19 TaxID=3025315 RepID=UPI002360ABB8|nr:hypothetical protein [Erythrobacter sp. BLCC-B19]WDA39693.1 hypothetical protein PS060_08935 [Erythrobacter sp. BLCC-B19]
MIASLLLLAASALDLGTSPLAAPGHAHNWTEFENNEEGIGWVDEAWRSETVVDGRRLKLVLLRADIRGEDAMVVDMIMAVDCERNLLGVKEGWIHTSEFAENMRLPMEGLTMDFADSPPSEDDREMIDFACKADR